MTAVLWDTDALQAWLLGEPTAKLSLDALFAELKQQGPASYFLSAITIQELAVGGVVSGRWSDMWKLLNERCAPALDVTAAIAIEAASLFVRTRPKPLPKGKARQEQAAILHRDCTIAATAKLHGIGILVTFDAGFRRYREELSTEIRVLDRAPTKPAATPSQ